MTVNDDLFSRIARNFAELTEREYRVFKDVFGVEMVKLPTLEELGVAFDMTRERFRKFEERVRRHPPFGE